MKSRLLKTQLFLISTLLLLASQAVAKTVTLSWDASPSVVSGYKVYYDTGSVTAGTAQVPLLGSGAAEGNSPIDAGRQLTYTVTGLPDDQEHSFAVVAYDAAGNESEYSNFVESSASVIPPEVTPPDNKNVTLSWDPSPSSVVGYKIYYVAGTSQGPLLGTGAAEGDSPIDVGNVLTFSVTGLPENQSHSFAVVAYDASGNESNYSNIVQSSASVSNGGSAPVLAAIGTKSILEGASLNFTISATDADGDQLTYSASSLPNGAAFNAATRVFSWTPTDGQAGNHSVTFTVSDGNLSDSETINITINAAPTGNRAPVLDSIGPKAVPEGETQYIPVSATDPDGDRLAYSVANLPDGAVFDASTRMFVWATDPGQAGIYSVTFSVSDGSLSDSETISLTVTAAPTGNRAPVLSGIGNKQAAENSSLSFTVKATDSDGDNLSYRAETLPNGANLNPATGFFSWAPDYAQAGAYSVTFSVSDGSLTDKEVIAINVKDVNRAPLIAKIDTQTVAEGSAISFTISGFDPDNDGLTYSVSELPGGASFNPSTRLFSWTPPFETTENTRIYPVTFTVSDGSLSDSETVTINVTNVNRAPVMETIGTQSLTEGDSLNLIVNASDPDQNSLTFSAENLPDGAVFIPSTLSLSWIPTIDQAGSYKVTFRVSDGSLSDSETVTLNVADVNEAPVLAAIGSQKVNEGVRLELNLTATDQNSNSLTFSAEGLPEGAVFRSGQQRFVWTPDYTQAGNYTVTFTVSDGVLSDSETVEITVVNSNQSPIISGSPDTTVMARGHYSFTPTASDPDDDILTFSISNKPDWATFDTTTGQLSGTPTDQQLGTTSAIAIGASDGNSIVFLPLFAVEVQPLVALDSDGDGVFDHLDAFPNDGNEWLDTDGDQIGNNADPDDDNDGVSDMRDGAPLDSAQSGWLITASTGPGGFITPEGQTAVLYGGSQIYNLTPIAGYYVKDLLIDNVAQGTAASYQFENITSHHTIEALFTAIPSGLSVDPTAAGLPGVDRVDGGDDSNNLVSSIPKLDIAYRFSVVVRDAVTADRIKVYLSLDNYRYLMELESGTLPTGALYSYTTRLGPAYAHQFHFTAEDNAGNQLWRYPIAGELDGPTVELLQGKNVIGVPGNIDSAALDSGSAFNVTQAYRWIPADKLNGSYERVDNGGPVIAGEGYVLKRTADETLPSFDNYGEISTPVHGIEVKPGWNLIANPYRGNVPLVDVQVQVGSQLAQDWLTAATNNILLDGVYYYLGVDWGNKNAFESAAGADSAILIPWIGYWIYVNPTDQPVKLLIPRPQQ